MKRQPRRTAIGLETATRASIPDLERLASVYGDDGAARFVWRTAGICPSVLGPGVSWLERFQVAARERASTSCSTVCARYENCRFDDFAVNAYAFDRDEVSSLDYFHPSLAGQRALASIRWSRSWWGP